MGKAAPCDFVFLRFCRKSERERTRVWQCRKCKHFFEKDEPVRAEAEPIAGEAEPKAGEALAEALAQQVSIGVREQQAETSS